MKKLLTNLMKFTQVLSPATWSATSNTSGVDMADFGSVTFLVSVGSFTFDGTNKIDIKLQHADVDTDASYADCVDADIYNAVDGANGIVKTLNSTADQNTVHVASYRGNKRYTRVRLVEGGTVSVALGVAAVRGHSELNPPL